MPYSVLKREDGLCPTFLHEQPGASELRYPEQHFRDNKEHYNGRYMPDQQIVQHPGREYRAANTIEKPKSGSGRMSLRTAQIVTMLPKRFTKNR